MVGVTVVAEGLNETAVAGLATGNTVALFCLGPLNRDVSPLVERRFLCLELLGRREWVGLAEPTGEIPEKVPIVRSGGSGGIRQPWNPGVFTCSFSVLADTFGFSWGTLPAGRVIH